eukprot:scaffold70994_cov19-Prasinocladus_malaysianus.AAC.3
MWDDIRASGSEYFNIAQSTRMNHFWRDSVCCGRLPQRVRSFDATYFRSLFLRYSSCVRYEWFKFPYVGPWDMGVALRTVSPAQKFWKAYEFQTFQTVVRVRTSSRHKGPVRSCCVLNIATTKTLLISSWDSFAALPYQPYSDYIIVFCLKVRPLLTYVPKCTLGFLREVRNSDNVLGLRVVDSGLVFARLESGSQTKHENLGVFTEAISYHTNMQSVSRPVPCGRIWPGSLDAGNVKDELECPVGSREATVT